MERIDDTDGSIQTAAFKAIGVARPNRELHELLSNHLYDALNNQEEYLVAGVCVFLRMLVNSLRQSDVNAFVEEGAKILRSMQEGMFSALRHYPSNKVIVEMALANFNRICGSRVGE